MSKNMFYFTLYDKWGAYHRGRSKFIKKTSEVELPLLKKMSVSIEGAC